MSIVVAKCTQCGANINVDATKEASVCEYCGVAFITEKAINYYNTTNTINISNATINMMSVNVDNLLIRAKEYEHSNEIEKALEYYNKILDVDATHSDARESVERIKNTIPICSISFLSGLFNSGDLILTRKNLTYQSKKKTEVYPIETIKNVKRLDARLWVTIIESAIKLNIPVGNIQEAAAMEEAINNLIREK